MYIKIQNNKSIAILGYNNSISCVLKYFSVIVIPLCAVLRYREKYLKTQKIELLYPNIENRNLGGKKSKIKIVKILKDTLIPKAEKL